MPRLSFSLRNKLLLGIMPLITIGFLSIIVGAHGYINEVIKEQLSTTMLRSVDKSAESINRWLQTIMIEPETIAATPAAQNINYDFDALDRQNRNRHLFLRSKYPDLFTDIYAANSDGEYHTIQEDKERLLIYVGNIADRPYFQSIMNGGPTQITPPLISRTTGIPSIFMVSPIVNNDGIPQGLIGTGLSLKYIQQIAKELKSGSSGYGFLIAQDGTYIYHPNSKYILHNSITDFSGQATGELGKRMISGESGIFQFVEAGEEMVAFFHPIPIAGWSIGTALPAEELFAPANRMLRMLAIVMIIFLLIISVAIFLITAHLTEPLMAITHHAREIAAGKTDLKEIPITNRDEAGMVAAAFNVMTKNLSTTLTTLRQSEDKYRSIFENAVEGICQINLDGSLLNVNPACAEMLGIPYSSTPLVHSADSASRFFAIPEDRDHLLMILGENDEIHNFETQLQRTNGERIWVSINASLIYDNDGKASRIDAIFSNITDKKNTEQEKEQLQLQLMQAQKLEAVGQLAGGVAHDFNNMLAIILGLTELALLKASPQDSFYATFKEIDKAAKHSAELTRQLLAFARRQTVTPKVMNINEAIDSTVSMLRRLIGEDIELTLKTDNELRMILMDPGQFGQIITNLCVNARDAIPGPGKITITTGNRHFSTSDALANPDFHPGNFVFLSVRDNGRGMDKETLSHIFEPFYTTSSDGAGTGLGMATVYGIVKQNDGFIDIESDLGKGTKITVFLPQHDMKMSRTASQIPSRPASQRKISILLVEDEPELLNITRKMLIELGHRVIATSSPQEAISLSEAKHDDIELLMTDVIMPTMNGRELSEKIRRIIPGLRCLFMSGYTSDIITTRSVLEDDVHFLEKPFSLSSLSEKLTEF